MFRPENRLRVTLRYVHDLLTRVLYVRTSPKTAYRVADSTPFLWNRFTTENVSPTALAMSIAKCRGKSNFSSDGVIYSDRIFRSPFESRSVIRHACFLAFKQLVFRRFVSGDLRKSRYNISPVGDEFTHRFGKIPFEIYRKLFDPINQTVCAEYTLYTTCCPGGEDRNIVLCPSPRAYVCVWQYLILLREPEMKKSF